MLAKLIKLIIGMTGMLPGMAMELIVCGVKECGRGHSLLEHITVHAHTKTQ